MFHFVNYLFAVRHIFRNLWRETSRDDDLNRIVINQDDLDRLATNWEISNPDYDHDKLIRQLKTTLRQARAEEKVVLMGRGYFDITLLVREAYVETCQKMVKDISYEAQRRGRFFQYEADLVTYYCGELTKLTGFEHELCHYLDEYPIFANPPRARLVVSSEALPTITAQAVEVEDDSPAF